MIVVKEKKSVLHADVRCDNCGSLLQYGNVDLYEDYLRAGHNYYFKCPVCGCKVTASWLTQKGE